MKMLQSMRSILWMALLITISACQIEPTALPTQAAIAASPVLTVMIPSPTAQFSGGSGCMIKPLNIAISQSMKAIRHWYWSIPLRGFPCSYSVLRMVRR